MSCESMYHYFQSLMARSVASSCNLGNAIPDYEESDRIEIEVVRAIES